MEPPKEQLTDDGYDQTLDINLLGMFPLVVRRLEGGVDFDAFPGPFYFTTLILPSLLAGAASSPEKSARIVNTSSLASELASKIDYDAFKDSPKRKKLGLEALYNQSKFVRVSSSHSFCHLTLASQGTAVFSNELARRYGDKGIISTAVNPGAYAHCLLFTSCMCIIDTSIGTMQTELQRTLTGGKKKIVVRDANSAFRGLSH